MMLAGVFFLLFLTGGNTFSPELHDERKSNHSLEEMPGGNTSSPELHDQRKSNHSSEEIRGTHPTRLSVTYEDRTYTFRSPAEAQDFIKKIQEDTGGGNTTGLEPQEFSDDQQASISKEILGGNTSSSEPLDQEHSEHPEDKWSNCTFKAILSYLNLTTDTDLYTVGRPMEKDHSPTKIYLDMKIHAVLDVRVSDQVFIAYLWIYLKWNNAHISWSPSDFCGCFDRMIVPTNLLWMPDLIIEEMIEKDKTPVGPYLSIMPDGWIEYRNDQLLIGICKMFVYKFPFDRQSCNISFKSIMYSENEVQLLYNPNNSEITEWSRNVMDEQFEWLFINQTVSNQTVNHFRFNQTLIVFTITMQRRSVLYIVNFLLPVLLFLGLDLASFLISDTGGEKISFKVTVLLAITVMQLILHEILPSSSNRIPLIGIYCFGVFFLMLLSLLETILVVHLIEKDSASKDNETDRDQSLNGDKQRKANVCTYFKEMKKCFDCASIHDVSADETPSAKEGSSSQLIEVSLVLEKVSDELVDTEKTMTKLSGKKEEVEPGYWTRVVKKINKLFFIFYVTTATVFLGSVFFMWFIPEASTDDV